MNTLIRSFMILFLCATLGACANDAGDAAHDHGHGDEGHAHEAASAVEEPESWAITSWGEHFEILAETDPLTVGQVSHSHTHVTALEGFRALTEGRVSAILRAASGAEQVFSQDAILRPGIFSIEIAPTAGGEHDLIFRVEAEGKSEDIPSGRVRVGESSTAGAIIGLPPRPSGETPTASAPVGFLKEQQWRTEFSTVWVTEGALPRVVSGPGHVRGAGAGDIVVSAPINGIVASDPIVHVGLSVRAGQTVLRLQPRAGEGLSISELRSELAVARSRLERVEKLLEVGAVSPAEVEAARARVNALAPLAESTSAADDMRITSPLTGRVAEVWAHPGRAVQAGDSLMRVVRTNPVWLEVALDPQHAGTIQEGPVALHLRVPGSAAQASFAGDAARLIAISPALHPVTGKVTALFEVVDSLERFRIGSTVNVEVSTAVSDTGVIVPISSLVDDGGATVVYTQVDGESFERHEVHVVATGGGHAIVQGVTPGHRLVTKGGAMIRRASLLSSGGIEGHVH